MYFTLAIHGFVIVLKSMGTSSYYLLARNFGLNTLPKFNMEPENGGVGDSELGKHHFLGSMLILGRVSGNQ